MPRKLLFALCLVVLLSGCRQNSSPEKVATPSSSPSTGSRQDISVRAKVVSVKGPDVMLDHEAVPGFMGAMTMSYKLKDPSVGSELHPGDRITATFLVTKDSDGLDSVLVDQIVVVAQARPDYKPTVQYHVPQPGDEVPDFKLLNQNDRTIRLSQFHGKALLITFVYTRCQLSEYCPRMSRNFAEIDKALAADPALYGRTHLLSISFDPTYDSPKVLRSYGGAYTGQYTKETFKHWDFAAPSEVDLVAVTQFFNVGVTPGDSKSLNHSLSTVLIGKDGKVAAWFPTNDWKVDEVVAQIKRAAA